nr:methyl-accepting chemotaxis protein [Peribacillus frigoritolerans]
MEAARAGDAGRGFAVVAQEVQKLAVQTDESIDIISESIMRINEQTAKVIQNNDESFQDILNGVSLVENNGEIFNKIFESVEKLLKGTEQLAVHSKKSMILRMKAWHPYRKLRRFQKKESQQRSKSRQLPFNKVP